MIATGTFHSASAQQIPCPVNMVFDAPDGSFNAPSCEVTAAGALFPVGGATFTNLGSPDNAALTNNGSLGIQGNVTWINEAGATINNNAIWSAGILSLIDNAGTIHNNLTGTLAGQLVNSGTFNNAGSWSEFSGQHSNTGDIFNLGTGMVDLLRIDNQIGGMVDNAGHFELGGSTPGIDSWSNSADIFNSGTFLSEMGPTVPATSVFDNTATGTFTNQSGGQATFEGGVENRGTITNLASGTMTHNSGNVVDFSILDGGGLSNAGTFNLNGRMVAAGAGTTITNSGMFFVNRVAIRNLVIDDGATLDNQLGGTITVDRATLLIGNIGPAASTANNAGVIDVLGTGGSRLRVGAAAVGTLNNLSTGVINIDDEINAMAGISTVGTNGSLNNAGIVNLLGPLTSAGNGNVNNQAGGTFNVTAGALLILGGPMDNAGMVNVDSTGGIIGPVAGQYTQTAGSTNVDSILQAFVVDFQGGTLGGVGTVESTGGPILIGPAATVNSGNSPGLLTMIGDVDFDGTLTTEFINASSFDVLDIQGNIDFGVGSQLEFLVDSAFPPADGLSLTFLTAEGLTGFGTLGVSIIGLNPLFTAAVELDAPNHDLSLTFTQIPLPSALWLLSTSLLGYLGYRGFRQRHRSSVTGP